MEPIDKCLKLIGQKCTKVLHLDLFIDASVPISDRFFDVVNHFKALKKIENRIDEQYVSEGKR